LCSVLEIKAEVGLKIKDAYEKKDSTCLRWIAQEQLPELSKRIRDLRDAHRNQWFKINKPFGWEVLDIRYGGLSYRVDSAIKRLVDYLEGRIERIEELEEERLYFDGPERDEGIGLGRYKQYWRIVTANYYSQ